tara:strand:- start:8629 stop:9276 length:648 start_codon:yes stop_codon:yes gene_type:complete
MADEPNDAPVADTPKADAPVADTPKADTPKADAPADTPAADTPKADAPKDGDAPKDAPKADAPADYTTLKLPEGYKADDPVFADAVKLFEGEKISPAQAQKLLDFTVERDKAMVKAVQDQSAAQWAKQTDEWKTTAAKEFDEAALGDAKTALAQVFDKETVTYLESMGFTNHPGLIRGMVKVSKAIKDDTWVSGNAGQVNGSDARKAFPNSNMNP